jgi:hypothetical protein
MLILGITHEEYSGETRSLVQRQPGTGASSLCPADPNSKR